GRAVGDGEVGRVGRAHHDHAAGRLHGQGEAGVCAGAPDLDRVDQVEVGVELGQLGGEVAAGGVQGLAGDVHVPGGVQPEGRDGRGGIRKVVLVEVCVAGRVQADERGGAGERGGEIDPVGVHGDGVGDDVAVGAGDETVADIEGVVAVDRGEQPLLRTPGGEGGGARQVGRQGGGGPPPHPPP